MAILKDTEREQLRQLVKACLLEISKLKIELKKCQKESNSSIKLEKKQVNEKDQKIKELEAFLSEKEAEINKLKDIVKERDDQLEESKKIKLYFDALTARPKKDLTSFQSQVYQLLSMDKQTAEDHYNQIIDIGFTELSLANFHSILRNLERKGYFKSSKEDGTVFWEKIEK
jgi:predicted RNase H-like nuclease (RuvC/YqgF family)